MRLNRLDLVRYGKFTGTSIVLPRRECDFHLVAGPNEAGKSTLRTAITELLFGMPRSSPLGFLHPQAELRLGAVIEGTAGTLEFHRTKSTKSPLRSPADAALPDDALAAYLGAADRSFFEQMFGLDHAQLVRGGQSILDASNDVGQVLFESAAGIAGLGRVRDALAAEASRLWAPRKAGDRAYYIAAARLEEAERDLRSATVRTRAWVDAQAALEAAQASFEDVRRSFDALEACRVRLERVRRLSPLVQTLRSRTAELHELGAVVELPADASRILAQGQESHAVAQAVLRQRQDDVTRLQAARDAVRFEGEVLSRRHEIEVLEAFRHRVRDHAGDIELRRREVQAFLAQVRADAAELGWPDDEEQLRSWLPSATVLKRVDRLLKSRGALEQAGSAARVAGRDKRREIEGLEAELVGLPDVQVPVPLTAALSEAQALRNTGATQRALQAARDDSARAQADALGALGRWVRPVEELRTMALPTPERLSALLREQTRLQADVRAARERLDDASRATQDSRLAVQQYTVSRRIVTADEVRQARASRDQTWGRIKSGTTQLDAGAAALDAAIGQADQLADTQLGSATAAARLQGLRQQVERDEAHLEGLRVALAQKEAELQSFEQAWRAQARAARLDGMPLEDMPAWLARRDAAVAAAAAAAQRSSELDRERAAASAAVQALVRQLHAVGLGMEGDSLAAACGVAEGVVRDAQATHERRTALQRQIEQGRRVLAGLDEGAGSAAAALAQWDAEWVQALAAAHLGPAGAAPAEAEAALERVRRVTEGLDKVAAIRRERIDTMQRDLERFAEQTRALAAQLDPAAELPGDAALASRRLGERLQAALGDRERWLAADKSLSTALEQRDAARLEVDAAAARIAPLLVAAGVAAPAQALAIAGRSDRRRQLLLAIDDARAALAADTDGLGVDLALAEVDASDIAELPGQLARLGRELAQARDRLTAATEQRLQAQQSVDAISGSADAALAEARRQEALAAMADATERYVKVATAARLLRWAIDRYRDRKQGPLLARAGTIFAGLTLGRYRKLIVDYDRQPLSLTAQRATGEVVEVPGLSEGTRDQLYLALRLAALELHLARATPLPFIADDLFVNFDDDRSRAGLQALRELAAVTQVVFLTHHQHLADLVREVFGPQVDVVELAA